MNKTNQIRSGSIQSNWASEIDNNHVTPRLQIFQDTAFKSTQTGTTGFLSPWRRKQMTNTSSSIRKMDDLHLLENRVPSPLKFEKPTLTTKYLDLCSRDFLESIKKPQQKLKRKPKRIVSQDKVESPKKELNRNFSNVNYKSKFLPLAMPTKSFQTTELLESTRSTSVPNLKFDEQRWKQSLPIPQIQSYTSRPQRQSMYQKADLPLDFETVKNLNVFQVNVERIQRLQAYQKLSKQFMDLMSSRRKKLGIEDS